MSTTHSQGWPLLAGAGKTEGGAMTMDRPKPSESGEAWASGDAASGWKRGAAARGRALDPMTELMLDLAGVTVGSQVLDLGAGTGDQTLMAARRIGPGGMVLATDISASMLALTQEAARAADLPNVQTRVMDAQRLELESGSFDAAIARFSLQFIPDVQRALAEVRRVLKPGGRFAAVVFSAVERNPFRAAPQAIASRLAGKQFPESGPGQWALNDPTTPRDAFQQAGFRDVDVRPVPFVYRFSSLANALRNLEEAQPLLVKLLDELSEDDRATAWAEINQTLQPFVGPDGFAAPSEALIVVGVA
jgi:ubiquinone/menaquinone biosynthesis C-methylase UbiE